MAEFCFNCFNEKIADRKYKKEELEISKDNDLDICEGCGKITNVVIKIK